MYLKKIASTLSVFSALAFTLTACGNSVDTGAQPQSQVTTVLVQQAAPSAESSPAKAETSAAPAQVETTQAQEVAAAPGSNCGLSDTGASTLVVAENAQNLTCTQVQSVFAEYNKVFDQSTANFQVQGLTCHTRTEAQRAHDGRSVTCKGNGTRLEAMLYYPLGGIPVDNPESYMMGKMGGGMDETTASFQTDDALHCSISTVYGVECIRDSITGKGIDTIDMKTGQPATMKNLQGVLDTMLNGEQHYLAPGQVISAYGVSCLNNGSTFTCTDGSHSFTASLTVFEQG